MYGSLYDDDDIMFASSLFFFSLRSTTLDTFRLWKPFGIAYSWKSEEEEKEDA